MLRDDALLWYRVHRSIRTRWEDFLQAFRAYFMPRRYKVQLLWHIRQRQQREDEPYSKYLISMLTMMRRTGQTDDDEQLETLCEGLRPAYKQYVRRDNIRTLTDLSSRAFEFEAIVEEERETQPSQKLVNTRHTAATASYSHEECCWRCKQRGHTRTNCQRPPRKFYSFCGKDGVLTRDCHPPPGNLPQVGAAAASPRPNPHKLPAPTVHHCLFGRPETEGAP